MPLIPVTQIAAAQRGKGVAFWDSGVTGQEALPSSTGQSARIINALFSDHPWDTAYMAGYQLPGLCEVQNGLTEIGIDNKKADGTDGSTLTVKGYKPGKFEISCTTWTAEQWDVLQTVIGVVWRKPKKRSRIAESAFDVSHPSLQLLGVTSCIVQAVTYPQPGKFEGSKVVTFKCVENVPSGKKRVTKTAKAGAAVVDALQSKITDHPANVTPPRPSTVRASTGPRGPRALPESGHAG